MGASVLKLNKVHLFAQKWQISMLGGLLLRKYFCANKSFYYGINALYVNVCANFHKD